MVEKVSRYGGREKKRGEMVVKISLIIPVYNKAPFLERCLDSVANQINKLVQIILIDDGSTDESGQICARYSERYGWDLWRTQNKGVSEARNLGIERALGEYITFLDADDFLHKDAFQIMLHAVKSGRNIYQFGQYRPRNCVNFNERLVLPYFSPEGTYDLNYIPRYWVHVWNKVYKKSFLDENKIRFRPGMQFGEDTIFNTECLLANNGFYHANGATVYHVLDDKNSLCRGAGLDLGRIEYFDDELCKLYENETDPVKKSWLIRAINQHRHSKLFRKKGFNKGYKGSYDVVYLVKESPTNPELVYSLRSLEENWEYKSVWFCGGCPDGLKPDCRMKLKQVGLNKWAKVRNMLIQICQNDEITENFWLFNDDFYVLKKTSEDMLPQYNGDLKVYIDRIERRQGGQDGFTVRLQQAYDDLVKAGLTTLNYEVHKPMLFNRKKLLEVFEKFPNTPAYRSLYGNYWRIGGHSRHDMKIKILNFKRLDDAANIWDFLSTSDESFRDGNVGELIRTKFYKKSRFERS